MKRILSLLLVLTLVFVLGACRNEKDNISESDISTTQTETSKHNNSKDFVIGEELVCGNKLPFDFPLYKSKNIVSTIDTIKIEKYKECDINNVEDFLFIGINPETFENPKVGDDYELVHHSHLEENVSTSAGYIFYKYQYKITVCGKTDKSLAGAYIYLFTDIDDNLLIPKRIMKINGGGFEPSGAQFAFLVKEDGSFDGEYIVYSNENLNQYNVIGFTRGNADHLNTTNDAFDFPG